MSFPAWRWTGRSRCFPARPRGVRPLACGARLCQRKPCWLVWWPGTTDERSRQFFSGGCGLSASVFVLVGCSVEECNDALRPQTIVGGLQSRAFLLGQWSDMAALTAGLNIVTSSSSSEAFPNAISEAMSCGVPCVVTDVGDAKQAVGSTGYVVIFGNLAALTSACRWT